MTDFSLGDRVKVRGRPYYIRGFSSMGVVPSRVILEGVETGERVEVLLSDVAPISEQPCRVDDCA